MGQTTTPGAANRARLSTCPSVWSFWSPSPSQSTFCAPRSRARAASATASVQPALRLGLSRHWRVVSTVPSPSWSRAPPSSTASVCRRVAPAAPATWAATSSSCGRSYLPPQPLNRNPTQASGPRKMGPVSRSQTSPNRPGTISMPATPSSRRRASASPASDPVIRRTRSPPGPARARARASTSSWAGARLSSQRSSWLGKPNHMARCGAHSAGTGRDMARFSLRGRGQMGEAGPGVKPAHEKGAARRRTAPISCSAAQDQKRAPTVICRVCGAPIE